jgi:hypothetical protein
MGKVPNDSSGTEESVKLQASRRICLWAWVAIYVVLACAAIAFLVEFFAGPAWAIRVDILFVLVMSAVGMGALLTLFDPKQSVAMSRRFISWFPLFRKKRAFDEVFFSPTWTRFCAAWVLVVSVIGLVSVVLSGRR